MDNLRGPFPDSGEVGDEPNEDYGEDETGRELPPAAIGQDERRMQVRAYNFWASLLEDHNFPSVDRLDAENLPDFGPYSVLLDFTGSMENPRIRFLGEALAEECGSSGTIGSLADVPSRSLLSRITDHYMQILANQAPIGFEAEFVNQRGATILYRGILLPFSSDDVTIDFIYGVINWKELADQQTTDELLLEIDQALEPNTGAKRDQGPLTEWADGPTDTSGVLELTNPFEPEADGLDWPRPTFGEDRNREADVPGSGAMPDEAMALSDWLASARELALLAQGAEERSRLALYQAIGRAYDFSIAASAAPEEFATLVADAGLAIQERAPMTPVVKLVFGAHYDKTRLAEYASALGHGHRLGLPQGALADFLASAPGGLKGVVGEERRLRREEIGAEAPARGRPREALARKLRKLDPLPLSDLDGDGEEFTLLVARRLATGEVVLLGEVPGDGPLLERAAKRLLR